DVSNTKMGEKIADSVQTDASQYVSTIDTTIWISNFRQFREAVYHRNKQQAKAFVDFPIMNDNNEIWHLVYKGTNIPPSLN
ncbi:MAG: hypothetical protein SFU87_20955, partial [Chitinophagaceae bacterium]|nr:hypothetical protein [Chitinophagaceae bacterium]